MEGSYLFISGKALFAHFEQTNNAGPATASQGNDGSSPAAVDLNDIRAKHWANRMNIIRFLAIASIVWGHSAFILEKEVLKGHNDQYLQSFLLQSGKIGTILFFLISGFFLAGQINRFNAIGYLRYRLFSLIIPWFIFLSIATFIQTAQTLVVEKTLLATLYNIVIDAKDYYKGGIIHGAYWFIPLSIFSSMVLITLKKHVNKIGLGVFFGAVTFFYGVNLHYSWVSTMHSKAFLGYAFFMWLGVWIKNNLKYVDDLVNKLSWKLLLPVAILLFALACLEGFTLHGTICEDPYASIRFTNALFCITLFIALAKTNRMQWINKLNPQGNVYGIYLVHCVIIIALFPVFKEGIIHYNLLANLPKLVLIEILFYLFVMAISYGIVVLLKRSSLAFVIGRKYNQLKKTSAPTLQALQMITLKESISTVFGSNPQKITTKYSAN